MEPDTRTKEYLEKLGSVRLSETSRARMRDELAAYAHFHTAGEGVRAGVEGRSIERVPQGASLFRRIYNTTLKPMNALIIIALVLSGGTSFAAAGSVPGDLLYPVKVEVNENVKSAFAITTSAEAALQAELAKERLEEAETLALRGELGADASAQLATHLKEHVDAALAYSSEAEAAGDLETAASVRAELAGTLSTYASILVRLSGEVEGNDSTSLLSGIDGFTNLIATTDATATARVSAEHRTAIEAAIVNTDQLIATVEAKLGRAETKLSNETHAWVDARLDAAVKAQADARVKLQSELYSQSYTAVQEAIRIANEAEAMIDSALRIETKVNIKAGDLFEGVLNTNTSTNSKTSNGDQTATSTEKEERKDVDLKVDAGANVDVDTDIIDTNVQTNTAVDAVTDLGL